MVPQEQRKLRELLGRKVALPPFKHTHTKKKQNSTSGRCLNRNDKEIRAASAFSHLWAVTPWMWYPIDTTMNFSIVILLVRRCCHKAVWKARTAMHVTLLLLARYLAESHNVPVIEVEFLKRPHTKSWKFSDKHEKSSCGRKRGTG